MPVITEDKTRDGVIAPPRWPDGFDGGNDSRDSGSNFPIPKAQVAIGLLLTGVTMLFAGLSSAYIVMRGVPNWQSIAVPPLLWVNTLILIASSVTLEVARRAVRQDRQ